jgi:prevent-host-death family protein
MKQVSATQFMAQCLALLDEAAAGEEIVVTKHGRPVALVVAAELPADLQASVTSTSTTTS